MHPTLRPRESHDALETGARWVRSVDCASPVGIWRVLRSSAMRGLGGRCLGLLVLVVGAMSPSSAFAGGPPSALPDPDTQIARRHYDRGVTLYDGGQYADAAREFEAAKRLKPSPQLDFNIGRCDERLEQWGAAAEAFERYAATLPDGKEASELRARIAILRARAGDGASTVPDAAPSLTSRWWFWAGLGAVVVAGAAVGIGVAASGGGHTPSATTTDGTFSVRF